MKNIVLSAVAVLAMSSFAVAGGDIAPVEEPVVVPEPVVIGGGFYLGLAYSALSGDRTETYTHTNANGSTITIEDEFSSDTYSEIMLQAGYKFNSYVAVEGRYWFGIEDTIASDVLTGVGLTDFDASVDAWGIYVKPMYPVTDAFDIYALLGYGAAEYDYSANNHSGLTAKYSSDSLDGFSWGLGAAYSFTDNLAIFVDYVNIYDDSNDVVYPDGTVTNLDDTIDTWNFGVTYQF